MPNDLADWAKIIEDNAQRSAPTTSPEPDEAEDRRSDAMTGGAQRAPASCPHCIDATDCASVDVCCAVEAVYATPPSAAPDQGVREALGDLQSHLGSWKQIMTGVAETSARCNDPDDSSYIRHEIKVLERVVAALSRPAPDAAGSEWKDISTAPRDGTEILAYSEHGSTGTMLVRHIALCDFLTDSEIEKLSAEGMSDTDLETADWFHADFLQGGRLSPDCYPTRWQPVPIPRNDRGGPQS